MIPKIIHYCWFGGNPLPPLALECIASWRKFFPDYEIWEWSEGTTPALPNRDKELMPDKVMAFDVNIIPYTEEAYKQKKYAFVSDYARFWIMYKYGGVYFDTDVEVIRSMDDIIAKGNFMGFEQDPDGDNTPGKYAPRYCFDVALGLGFGMVANHPFMKKMMDYYDDLKFVTVPTGDVAWYKTIVAYTTEMLCANGLLNVKGIQQVGDVTIYPSEYFAPINAISRRLHVTNNTRTIHRYMASWDEKKNRSLKDYVKHCIPEWVYFFNNKVKRRKYKVR